MLENIMEEMKQYCIKQKLMRTHRFKHLEKTRRICRRVYNHFVKFQGTYYRFFKKTISRFDMDKHLTFLKSGEKQKRNLKTNKIDTICPLRKKLRKDKEARFYWWYEVPSGTLQDLIHRIDKSRTAFFKNIKKKTKSSPPKKKKFTQFSTFKIKKGGRFDYDGNHEIEIMGKKFKFYKSYENIPKDKIQYIELSMDRTGDWFIIFCIRGSMNKPKIPNTKNKVGLDFGLKTFITQDDGVKHESPLFYKETMETIREKSKKISKKKKGSNNKKKAIKEQARLFRKISNQREDHHNKLALELVRKNDTICTEDLNIKGMQKMYGRKINDLGFSSFMNKLEWKSNQYKRKFIKIDRFFPSSKLCSKCGEKNEKLELKDRIWVCSGCGNTHDRDVNAAKNILEEGTRLDRRRLK